MISPTLVNIICLVLLVVALIIIGALLEAYMNCEKENQQLKEINNQMSQIMREANIRNVPPKDT